MVVDNAAQTVSGAARRLGAASTSEGADRFWCCYDDLGSRRGISAAKAPSPEEIIRRRFRPSGAAD